jgi:hypothetical protein
MCILKYKNTSIITVQYIYVLYCKSKLWLVKYICCCNSMASGDLGCVVFGGVILNEGRHTQVVRAAAPAAPPSFSSQMACTVYFG